MKIHLFILTLFIACISSYYYKQPSLQSIADPIEDFQRQKIIQDLTLTQKKSFNKTKPSIICQTVASYEVLSAVAPEQLIAAPLKYIRVNKALNLLDTHPYFHDQLFIQPNLIAITASYSNPQIIKRLSDLKITQVQYEPELNPESILENIIKLTTQLNLTTQSQELLKNYTRILKDLDDSANMLNLKNKKIAAFFYLNGRLYTAGKKHQVTQLLKRTEAYVLNENSDSWMDNLDYVDFSREEFDYILIFSNNCLLTRLKLDKMVREINHKKMVKWDYVSDEFLHSPSQLMLIGYYDILHSLKTLTSNECLLIKH